MILCGERIGGRGGRKLESEKRVEAKIKEKNRKEMPR
jgi:hypothetical protein